MIAALLIIFVSAVLGFLIPLALGGGAVGWRQGGQAEAVATVQARKTATSTPTAFATLVEPSLAGLLLMPPTSVRQAQSTATPTATRLPTATPTATRMVMPTVTPTMTATPTATPTVTRVAMPTMTPTPTASAPVAVVRADLLNVRAGPGPEFTVLALAAQGDRFTVEGRSADGAWWQVCCVLDEQRGWVAAAFVSTEGDIEQVPVVR